MIWVAGQIVRDDALSVSVLDRTFEHGLGLFETFRTWNGHATLLPRHLERLKNAAADLGLPVPEVWQLPTEKDVHTLLSADERSGDAVLRITMSGGVSGSPTGAMVWMRSAALPAEKPGGYILGSSWRVPSLNRFEENAEELHNYKTLNYWERRRIYEAALVNGLDENLSIDEHRTVYEGSRTNLFVISGRRLLTPPFHQSIVQGIMRELVLELAEMAGLDRHVRYEDDLLDLDRVCDADEVFLTNSVRGMIPVCQLVYRDGTGEKHCKSYTMPGPLTVRLSAMVRTWLESGGDPK